MKTAWVLGGIPLAVIGGFFLIGGAITVDNSSGVTGLGSSYQTDGYITMAIGGISLLGGVSLTLRGITHRHMPPSSFQQRISAPRRRRFSSGRAISALLALVFFGIWLIGGTINPSPFTAIMLILSIAFLGGAFGNLNKNSGQRTHNPHDPYGNGPGPYWEPPEVRRWKEEHDMA